MLKGRIAKCTSRFCITFVVICCSRDFVVNVINRFYLRKIKSVRTHLVSRKFTVLESGLRLLR